MTMAAAYERGGVRLYCGDMREVCPQLDVQASALVCDPPYGLDFMGKAWDHGVPGVEFWAAAMAAALPGAHLLAFGGTRTEHRLVCAIEDAGWVIRDKLMWLYGSGMPKSYNLRRQDICSCVSCGNMLPYSQPNTKGVSANGKDRKSVV